MCMAYHNGVHNKNHAFPSRMPLPVKLMSNSMCWPLASLPSLTLLHSLVDFFLENVESFAWKMTF